MCSINANMTENAQSYQQIVENYQHAAQEYEKALFEYQQANPQCPSVPATPWFTDGIGNVTTFFQEDQPVYVPYTSGINFNYVFKAKPKQTEEEDFKAAPQQPEEEEDFSNPTVMDTRADVSIQHADAMDELCDSFAKCTL